MTVEIDNSDPMADAPRGAYEPPIIIDLGNSAELNRVEAGGATLDAAGYS